jgi:hypothetical protein
LLKLSHNLIPGSFHGGKMGISHIVCLYLNALIYITRRCNKNNYLALQPNVNQGRLILEVFRSHTVGRTTLDEGSACRRYLTTHNTYNRELFMPQRDSNPQSQQVIGRRYSPQTARSLGTVCIDAIIVLNSHVIRQRVLCVMWGNNISVRSVIKFCIG